EVNIAAQYGLVQGAGLGKFNPDLLVTREQMVVMMMNAVRFFNGSSIKGVYGDVPFVDQDQLSSYARNAVAEAVHERLISGKTATTFAPQAAATRVEAAVLLKQTLQYLKLMN
ncbi:S-layer homology domain-containing protein, partial [Xanthomonas citri pv. citri]